ncbi:hypothetical protein ES703_45316 [subsurface metagenome]
MADTTAGLGGWLAERCREEGLSLRQAAAKTGLSHTTIDAIMGGGSASAATIRKLAQAFAGNGQRRLVLEDKLLILAGYRTPRDGEELSEPLARVIDKLSQFSKSHLKLMEHFADFISDMEAK